MSSMALIDRTQRAAPLVLISFGIGVATGTTVPHQAGFETRKTVLWIAVRRSPVFEKAVAEAAEAKELGLEQDNADEDEADDS